MERLLRTVGIETFVKYYDFFNRGLDTNELVKVFERNGETWKSSSFTTKAYAGKAIFKKGYEIDALRFVAASNENRVGGGKLTIRRAKEILDKSFL